MSNHGCPTIRTDTADLLSSHSPQPHDMPHWLLSRGNNGGGFREGSFVSSHLPGYYRIATPIKLACWHIRSYWVITSLPSTSGQESHISCPIITSIHSLSESLSLYLYSRSFSAMVLVCSPMASGNMEASCRLNGGDGGKIRRGLRRKLKNGRSAPGKLLATFRALVSRLMACCDHWDEQGTDVGTSQVMNVDVYFSIPVLPAASTL